MKLKKNHFARKHREENLFKFLMIFSFCLMAGVLCFILGTVIVKGLPSLSWSMITKTPKGGYYLGKEGGILNAIIGSLYLAGGGTLLAMIIGIPLALLKDTYARRTKLAGFIRLSLDILWGVPSIVYGAFGFAIMIAFQMRASLLCGIIVLSLLELPIMTRAMDEVLTMTPRDLSHASYALGATRLETSFRVVARQIIPGIVTAVLLAFGRGIGDAASVLFTAGYTDRIPTSLTRPAASLPLAVFFQLGTPFPEVQKRAYAAALILTIIVLAVSLGSRWISSRLSRHIVK